MANKQKFDKDLAFKNIIGVSSNTEDSPEDKKVTPEDNTKIKLEKINSDKLIQRSYYITNKHVKALKIRTAMTEKEDEKDASALIRKALDLLLADELEKL